MRPNIAALERSLLHQIEKNLECFFGIRLLATEFSTGPKHRGRIDTLGIDENNCPVIIEYKRSLHESIINQGLFYLSWLRDHKGDFELLAQKKLGADISENIEWSSPRVLCIANDFTRYDEHAVNEINQNIELIRYRYFDNQFLLLETVNQLNLLPPSAQDLTETDRKKTQNSQKSAYKDMIFQERYTKSSAELKCLYQSLCDYILTLGDDIQKKELRLYTAFKRMKNFASIILYPARNLLYLYLKVDPNTVSLEKDFTRKVTNIGHWGTGDLEITIKNNLDLQKAQHLILKSYETN